MKQLDLLRKIRDNTSYTFSGAGFTAWYIYQPKGSEENRCLKALTAKGYVNRWGYILPAGWDVLGTTSEAEALVQFENELDEAIQRYQEAARSDLPSTTPGTVEWYREKYNKPEMTVEEVLELEQGRVDWNLTTYDFAIQDAQKLIERFKEYCK